tara:strand:+ start:727 stop:2544 length:1818 start_codon:yes stop_codon:yes gene_type:complete
MSCDKLVFDLSQEVEGSPSVFVRKDWLNILDNQNGNYNSNQSVIDTSQLSNSNKYMSYREAYLSVPMLLSLTSKNVLLNGQDAFLPDTPANSADYAVGLKNWFGQIIHSLTLDYNGTTIIQQTPFCNMWNSFRLMTSFSWGDVTTQGDTIGFYPDDPLTCQYNEGAAGIAVAASNGGIGTMNNCNVPSDGGRPTTTGVFARYERKRGNMGYIMRQQGINWDADGEMNPSDTAAAVLQSSLMSQVSASNLWKSHISSKSNGVTAGADGVIQWSIQATIYLKHLHSFFAAVPLLKGAYMKATLNLNNTSTNFVVNALTAGNTYLSPLLSVANAIGGVNPVLLSSLAAGNGGNAAWLTSVGLTGGPAANDTPMVCNLSVGAVCLDGAISGQVSSGALSRSIYLYVPSYTFNPVFEQAYLSSPVKQIKYTDIYQYQIRGITASTGMINHLVTNGIANIKSILILPFFASAGGLPTGMPVYQSPFDTAGTGTTSPQALISNFNVVVSGQNAIYNTQKYAFEQFNNQLYGVNAVNGGMTDGLTSGLIDRLGFDTNYGYYYVDLSRMLPVEESVPKSIQVIGQNMSQKEVDYFVFIEYGVEVSVDALTGVRV